jgi:hypothetical protein
MKTYTEGELLKKSIETSGYTATKIAELIGINSRRTLYNLYERETIPSKYLQKLNDIGIDIYNQTETNTLKKLQADIKELKKAVSILQKKILS